ncbi:DMT family transporter [Marinomonas sp. C1424]|uniref:DMT family transporter n=2 Tax=Marinomonas transparens TaxID=2795388 RepID=A0A934JUX2_9GAMM|nr:DMT family transporter [Marinomonas transparens]
MTISLRLCVFIFLALLAFAGNSILCRLALKDGLIDPASFTLWRLASGAFMLVLLCFYHLLKENKIKVKTVWLEGSWLSSFSLFIYALGFSYAYVSLSTGLGALVLFGAVQLTLILLAIWAGQKLLGLEWLGLIIAFGSFVYLVLPSLGENEVSLTSSLGGFVLMTLAGIAWGAYTWRGKLSSKPLFATASNFLRTIPILLILLVFIYAETKTSTEGILLAILSGAVMSGLGYALWYGVLPSISTSTAAVLQLLVPVIATLGGVLFANELITLHLIYATVGVLGGVLLVIVARKK